MENKEKLPKVKISMALLITKRMDDNYDMKENVEAITSYINHLDQLYIYNMTDQDLTPFYNLLTKYPNISYTNCENFGEVANYQLALDELIKTGCQFGGVMEQGYYYEEDTFLAMKRYLIEHNTSKIAVLTPMPLRGCEIHTRQVEEVRPCMGCNLVGTLLNLAIFRQLGGFKLEYYQTTFDYEYCIRARLNGYQILLMQNYVLRNSNYQIVERRILFIKLSTFDYDLMNLYYQTRNRFYLWDEYEKLDPKYVKIDKKLYKGERHVLKMRDPNYRDKFYMMEEAHYDYLKGRKGKYEGGMRNEKN